MIILHSQVCDKHLNVKKIQCIKTHLYIKTHLHIKTHLVDLPQQ